MNQLPNVQSIGSLPTVNKTNVPRGKHYAIKYRERGERRMDYVAKCISPYNFVAIYSREGGRNEPWSRSSLTFRLRQDSESSVHELPLNSPYRSLNQPREQPMSESMARLREEPIRVLNQSRAQPKAQNSINVNNNKVNLSKFKEMLTCKICLEKTVNQVLNCGHTLCKSCIDNYPMQFNCPFCRVVINKATGVKNLYFS